MSVSTLAHPSRHGPALAKFWLGIAILFAGAIGLAWLGTASSRDVLEVQTIASGAGPFIKPVDGVMIEYEGRLPNGTVFDSTAGKGPAPMIAGQTIPGFSQALAQMQQGGRYHVHIPAKLAYGARPPEGIPANSDLDFDVHIAEVVPDAALMGAPGRGGPQGEPQAEPGGGQ